MEDCRLAKSEEIGSLEQLMAGRNQGDQMRLRTSRPKFIPAQLFGQFNT
jgi:hypothetical protein